MADAFKLPNSSYDELVRIIQGYASFSTEVALEDVSRRLGADSTQISRNTGFLVSLGVLENGKSKKITALGKSLSQAIEHNIVDEISRYWREIVDNCEFLRNIVAAVRIRRGMDFSTLKSHVAYSAGQAKSSRVMTGAATVVEILKAAELLVDDDGKIVACEVTSPTIKKEDVSESAEYAKDAAVNEHVKIAQVENVSAGFKVSINIDVNVSASVDELPLLADKLNDLLNRLRNSAEYDEE